ncbi:MAG: hypothetical protein AABX17_03090 [Nanoarchaeota archaeon]
MALSALLLTRLIFILGITNIISLLVVMSTCRCMGTHKLTLKLYEYKWYQKFYSYHCYYWYVFILSVILHVIFAMILIGIPF